MACSATEKPRAARSVPERQPLSAAIAELERESGREISLSRRIDESRAIEIETPELQGSPWRDRLRELARTLDCDVDELGGGRLILTRSAVPVGRAMGSIVRFEEPELRVESSRPVLVDDVALQVMRVRLRWLITEDVLTLQGFGGWGGDSAYRARRTLLTGGAESPLIQMLRLIIAGTADPLDAVDYEASSNTVKVCAAPSVNRRLRTMIDTVDRLPGPVDLQAIRWRRGKRGPRCLINGQVFEPGEVLRDWSGDPIPALKLLGAFEGRVYLRHGASLYGKGLPGDEL